MKRNFQTIAVTCLLGIVPVASGGELDVAASTPDVPVSTRPEGRNFLRLPSLRYDFVLNASCPDQYSAQAVSLSIADTRVVVDEDALSSGPRLEVSVNVPAGQIAPVAVEDFCTRDGEEGSANRRATLRIPSALSAQAALTCGNEESSEITYASASLGVLLRCQRDDAASSESLR